MWFLTWVALATPLDDPAAASTADQADLLLESGVPGRDLRVRDLHGEFVPLRDLQLPAPPNKPRAARSAPVTHVGEVSGALSGRAVYVSQCHGWMWYDSVGAFLTQRGNTHGTVEDFHNPEGANAFLIPYLENAGASVFTARERDMSVASWIVDNADSGYSETGSSFQSGPLGWGRLAEHDYGDNPFRAGDFRWFDAGSGDVASWTVDVDIAGVYAIYVSWETRVKGEPNAHYRIHHPGGTIHRFFDQTAHGSTWQFVESLYLEPGRPLVIELVGDGTPGNELSADAVRVGGGMDITKRRGQINHRPLWEASALHYTQFLGAPPSVYDVYENGVGTDHSSRSAWASWEHPSGEDAVYLSWHSNAASGSARGTSVYYAGGGDGPDAAECYYPAVDGSYDLAKAVVDQIIDSARALWDPQWLMRHGDGVATACFSEVNPALNGEIPSALVELAFHDNETDANFLKHPRYRRDAARAMYHGIVDYFAARDGLPPVYLPEPPAALRFTHNNAGQLVLSWRPGPSGSVFGDPADTWKVELSFDGRIWHDSFFVDGPSAVVDVLEGQRVFARVSGVNDGGQSFASEVVGARRSPEGYAPVLVVGAFDRFDRGTLHTRTPSSALGQIVKMDVAAMNPGDTIAVHGTAVADAGWYFDSVQDERVEDLDLDAWDVIIWAAGEDSTVDEAVSTGQQEALAGFVSRGGALWISGAEVLWDLDYKGAQTDKAFASGTLGAWMVADDSGTDRVNGADLLSGVSLDFGWDVGGAYPVEYPDVVGTDGVVLAEYDGGDVAVAMTDQVVVWGFPFETVADPLARAEVAIRLLPELAPHIEPPVAEDQTEAPEQPGPDPVDPDDPPVEAPPLGCGCVSSGTSGSMVPLALFVVAGTRRRRKRA